MTNLITEEMKTLIQTEGVQIINIKVNAPKNLFSMSAERQHSFISQILLGGVVEVDFIKSITFAGVTEDKEEMIVNIKLELSNSLLEKLNNTELKQEVIQNFDNAIFIYEPMNYEEAVDFAKRGKNTFKVRVPKDFKVDNSVEQFLSNSIVLGMSLPVTILADTFYWLEEYIVVLEVQNFAFELSSKAPMFDPYKHLITPSIQALPISIGIEDLEKMFNSYIETGDYEVTEGVRVVTHTFNYLIELEEHELTHVLDGSAYEIEDKVLDSDAESFAEFSDEREIAIVGFNPLTNKTIVKFSSELEIIFD